MRFVVLHHAACADRGDHYDLMLQTERGEDPDDPDDPVLKTFATLTDEFPDGRGRSGASSQAAASGEPSGRTNLLRPIADHRRAYLSLQGPVSGGRGAVERVEEGAMEWLGRPEADDSEFRFRLDGRRLKGDFRLRRLGGGDYLFERL